MLPVSFSSKSNSSPLSGMEGLRRNIAAIGSTQPPPAAGSSLGCASILEQVTGEGLLSKLSGQASVKWSIRFSRLLIVTNARGLRGGGGGGGDATAMARPEVPGGNDQKRERGVDRDQ